MVVEPLFWLGVVDVCRNISKRRSISNRLSSSGSYGLERVDGLEVPGKVFAPFAGVTDTLLLGKGLVDAVSALLSTELVELFA